ncbi:uncharacterized protein [Diadema antillarum]|uniref:uncharacterized protein n=1 Tax=Diadema antillarum TaxID=105358 RepID=UPI003A8A3A4B
MALLDSKFQPWTTVREHLDHTLRTTDPEEHSVMVPYGLQLAHTLHHAHVLRCLAFYHYGPNGNNYVAHVDTGYIKEFHCWSLSTLQDEEVKCQRIKVNFLISKIIFVPQHRVFVGYSPDVTLHVFSDLINNCMELTSVHCTETVLCMVYNEDTDELITGGRGFIQAWKMAHVEIRDPLVRGHPIESQIKEEDWVRDLRVDRKRRQVVALCDEGVHIINYVTNREVYTIRNWHASALTCFVFYRKLEYCITASMDGEIKVWNAVVFKEVHQFVGHYDNVTGLVIHPADPLLISSSKDGTVRIWRLDTFELTQILNVGEKVLGMRLANQNQLYYYTLKDIKVWNFNLFHHLFTPVRSCVHKLARIVSPATPSRILCAAEDGGVRLISAVSGTELTIIYPMPSYQVLTDIVYDPKNALIVTVLEMGDVLVFDSSTNPCQARELLVPLIPEESVTCLALVKLDCALGLGESPDGDYLIFAGHASGQISLLECRAHSMKHPLQAHGGAILALECSHGACGSDREGSTNEIGAADRLISCGSDKMVKIWGISASKELSSVKLVCLKMVACTTPPTHVSMLGNVLCTTLETNTVEMYELLDNDDESPPPSVPQQQLANHIAANKVPGIRLLKHLKDHDHTKQITALCSCPCLGVFATTSNDGSLKIWDRTNTMVRELWFDETLRSVCFANDRGDLLVGFQNHISYVSIASYLPLSYMKDLLEMEFQDEIVEEPFPFNPDLPLWFDLLSLPTYPTDLLLRQHVKSKLPQLRKQILGIPIPGSASKEGSRQMSEAGTEVTSESLVGRHISELASSQHIRAQNKSGDAPSNGTVSQTHIQREKNQCEDKKETEEPKMETEKSVAGESRKGGDGQSVGGDGEGVVEREVEEEDKEGEEMEEMEKEKIIQLLVAPDGYIPNSVIRMLVQPPKPPTPPPPPGEWRPRSVPAGDMPVAAQGSEDTEYENHEPFTWASSEESTVAAETPVTTPSPQASANLAAEKRVAKQPGVAAAEKEEAEVNQGKIRKLSLKTVGRLVISHPGMSEERERTMLSKKKRRKGRGINTEQSKRKRYGKVGPLDDIQGEKEGSGDDEVAEDEEEERGPLDRLLNRITSMYWYPKGLKMDVLTTVKTLLNLLDNASDELYKFICSALIELNDIVGLSENLLDSIIRKFLRDLKSSLFMTRLNAIKTLANLHDNRPFVVLSVLNSMTDEDASIQQEAAEALDKLVGISTKEAMEKYLASIGILSQHQEDPLADLAQRCRRERQRGESTLLTSVTSVVERRLSSISPPRERVYSPEMVEEWLERMFHDRQLYEYKHKGKPHAPIQKKKKRRMSLVHRPHRQEGQDEGVEQEILEEEFEDDDEEDEEEEEEDYYDSGDEGMIEEDSLPGEDYSVSEEQHPRQRKLNKHEAMMLAKEASMQREKLLMEKAAKEKMRRHIEEYEKAMKRKRRKMKHLLPYHAGFYSYYDRLELLERQGRPHHPRQPRQQGLVSKSILNSVSDLVEATVSSTVETSQSAWEQEKSSAHLKEDAHESNDEMSGDSGVTPNRPKKLDLALGGDVLEGDESAGPGTCGAGTGVRLERRKWKMDQLIAEGHATPWHPKFGRPDEQAGDSGLGDSMVTGPSQLLTLDSSGREGATSDTLFGTEQGGEGMVPTNKSNPRDLDVRPKSNLTMANLRRHELLSARAEKRGDSSHCGGKHGPQPRANWRDFFHLPEIQERRQQNKALRALQDAQSRSLATEGGARFHHLPLASASNHCYLDGKVDTVINCIPRGVAFTPGSSGRRLLHTVTMGSRGKGQECLADLELPKHTGRQGTTNYGALQMSWACMTPQKANWDRMRHLVTPAMEGQRGIPSQWRGGQEENERRCSETCHRNWLRTQMLYPSLFKLQDIDLAKQRFANAARPTRCEDIYHWERPLPIIVSKATRRVCGIHHSNDGIHHSNGGIGQPSKKPKQPTVENNGNRVMDSSSELEVAEGTPIVPRNSMASTGDPVTLPALMCGPNRDQVPTGARIARKPRPEIKAKS